MALPVFMVPAPSHSTPGLCKPTPGPPCPLSTLQTFLQVTRLSLGHLLFLFLRTWTYIPFPSQPWLLVPLLLIPF